MEINENVLWSVCELILAVRSESLDLGLSVDVNFISLTPHWWSSVIFIRTHRAKESRALISLSENHTRDSFAFDSPLAFHPCDPHPWPFLPKFCANYEIRTSSFNYFRLSIWKADVGLCLHYRTMQDTHTHTNRHIAGGAIPFRGYIWIGSIRMPFVPHDNLRIPLRTDNKTVFLSPRVNAAAMSANDVVSLQRCTPLSN